MLVGVIRKTNGAEITGNVKRTGGFQLVPKDRITKFRS